MPSALERLCGDAAAWRAQLPHRGRARQAGVDAPVVEVDGKAVDGSEAFELATAAGEIAGAVRIEPSASRN